MKRINILLLLLAFSTYGCSSGSDAAKALRNEKVTNKDEFFIRKQDPLSVPPNFESLPQPRSMSQKENKEGIEKILDISKSEEIATSSTSTERSILKEIKE